jgi:glycosyltransferase involved in cell wall biosynthesis
MSNSNLRLAYFSPLPPVRSGIADYSQDLLPWLGRLADVTLFAESPADIRRDLRSCCETQNLADYPTLRWQYDLAIYQMGDSMAHDAIYSMLVRYPGLTVLHDYGLHHFICTRTVGRGDFAGYVMEMGYALGLTGTHYANEIRRGKRTHPLYEVPLNDRLIDSSLGVIVHSEYARDLIRRRSPDAQMRVVPAPIAEADGKLLSRSDLGCPPDRMIFASVGQITAHKQLTSALAAFAVLRQEFPDLHYVVVGECLDQELDLPAWLRERGLEDAVTITGFQGDIRNFNSWIAAADVLVNLREPTLGETSASALRGMSAGRPVVVTDHGWYAELPDDTCIKVPPGDSDALVNALRRLASDASFRRDIGRRAADYVHREHTPARAAERYVDFASLIISSICSTGG